MHKQSLMAAVSGLALLLGTGSMTAADSSTDQHGQLSSKDYKFPGRKLQPAEWLKFKWANSPKKKANSQSVRSFGEKMVSDHTKANSELRDLAAKKGATLPAEISHHDRSLAERLEKASGPEFDKAYTADVVKDHKKDLKEFRDAATHITDPDLKAWAQKISAYAGRTFARMAEQIDAEMRSVK